MTSRVEHAPNRYARNTHRGRWSCLIRVGRIYGGHRPANPKPTDSGSKSSGTQAGGVVRPRLPSLCRCADAHRSAAGQCSNSHRTTRPSPWARFLPMPSKPPRIVATPSRSPTPRQVTVRVLVPPVTYRAAPSEESVTRESAPHIGEERDFERGGPVQPQEGFEL